MRRRTVLGGGLAMLGLGGAAAVWWGLQGPPATSRLVAMLRPLAADRPAATSTPDPSQLLRDLLTSGVITAAGGIAGSRLQELAASEQLLTIAGWQYAESEVALFLLAESLLGKGILRADGIVLAGAELSRVEVADPIAAESVLRSNPAAVAASLGRVAGGWHCTVLAEPLTYRVAPDGLALLR